MSQKRNEHFYYQSGTMEKPTCGDARGFPEQWQAEQYLDEEREHAMKAARDSGITQLLTIVDNSAPYGPCVVYAEYCHGDKPQALRLAYGDFDVVVEVALVDGVPAIMSGVFDDPYHNVNEELSSTDLDNIGNTQQVLVEAYHKSLEFPGRAVFEREETEGRKFFNAVFGPAKRERA